MRPPPTAWVEVDLDAYRANLKALSTAAGCPVLAVVKANAYGHGLLPIAHAAVQTGVAGLAVARVEEGLALRESGLTARILVLSPLIAEQAAVAVEADLETVALRGEVLDELSRTAVTHGRPARIHVKVDTGMGRVGVEPEDVMELCRRLIAQPGLELAGVMTHFASADHSPEATAVQWSRFKPLVEATGQEFPGVVLHAANSAAAVRFPPSRLHWVRGGLITYGVPPAEGPLPFRPLPVASVHARILQIKPVPAGRATGYGGAWVPQRNSRIAVTALGYADGVPWALSNRGFALVGGGIAPIRGRVCMDQTMLDVTDLPDVLPGDTATFLGRRGPNEITATQLAELAGTIPYEILTRLADRLPRLASA